MNDEIERMAVVIHAEHPVTVDGQSLDWESVLQSQPHRAIEYREAAANRIKAAQAMQRLDEQTVPKE